jgi:hypothetical protein
MNKNLFAYLYHTLTAVQAVFQVYIQLYLYIHHLPYHRNQINTRHMIDYNCNHNDQDHIL